MATTKIRAYACLACVAALCLGAGTFIGEATAQSPVVFMTASYPSPSKVVRFDSGVESFAVTAGANGAFLGTTILNGDVLVADFRGEAIQRFSPSGTLLSPFALFTNPTFLESDSSGNVYTTHFSIGPAVATRFDAAGSITQTFSVVGSSELSGVDADAAGNVYVVDRTNDRLVKFASNGTLLNSVSVPNLSDDVAIDETGKRLFLADEGSAGLGIKVYDISGAMPVFTGGIATPLNAIIVGVHFAAESGNILAVDFGITSNTPRGLEYAPGGALLLQFQPAGADIAWDITTYPIPEPAAVTLLMIGVAGLITRCRRTHRRLLKA